MANFSIPCDKLLSSIFRIIVYGFKVIGLAPVSLEPRSPDRNSHSTSIITFQYSKIGLLYNLVLTILTLIIGTLEMQMVFSLVYPNKSAVNEILDIAQYFLEIFTASFVMVYSALKQKKAAYIMNKLLDVHWLLSTPEEQSSDKKMLILLAIHMTFNACLWTTFLISAYIFYNSLFDTIAICIPIFVSYSFLVEYSMVLGFLAKELESLNGNLLTLETFPNHLFRTLLPNRHEPPILQILPSHKKLASIKLLHSVRSTLDEVSQDVADFFSLPILPIILLYFCMVVYHVYYIIVPVLTPNSDLSLNANIFIIAWLIICIYPLILLSFYVTNTAKQAQLTGHLVHKLLATERKQEIITELEQFSLYLIHEDPSFTAYGFFDLDFKLLQSIFGATATYLVIIIQFVQSTTT